MRVRTDVMRRRRVSHGWSLRELARQSGLSYPTVQLIETGGQAPRPATVKRLADALEIEVDELIEWNAEQDQETGKAAA